MSSSSSVGRLLAPVAEQLEIEEQGRLLWTLDWKQRQKLFSQPDEARRKPRAVGCRNAHAARGRSSG